MKDDLTILFPPQCIRLQILWKEAPRCSQQYFFVSFTVELYLYDYGFNIDRR